MRKANKKRAAVVAAAFLVASGGTVAMAYWTSSGTGTGSGAVGTSAAITAVQTSTVTGMGPGVAAQDLSGAFVNDTATSVYVATVTAAISGVTAGGVPAVGCSAADFTLTNEVMDVYASIPISSPPGTQVGAWGGPADHATIAFNNTGANQDACKNVVVTLAYTIA